MTDSTHPAGLLQRGKDQMQGTAAVADVLATLRLAYKHAASQSQRAEARRWLWLASVRNATPAVFSVHQAILVQGLEAMQSGDAGAARTQFNQVIQQSDNVASPLLWLRGEAMALYVASQVATTPLEQLRIKLPKFQQDIEVLQKTTRSYPEMQPIYAAWLTHQQAIETGVAPPPASPAALIAVADSAAAPPQTVRLGPDAADTATALGSHAGVASAEPAKPVIAGTRFVRRRAVVIGPVALLFLALCSGAYTVLNNPSEQPTTVAIVPASPTSGGAALPVATETRSETPTVAPATTRSLPTPTRVKPTATAEPITFTVVQAEPTVNTLFSGASLPFTFTLPIKASNPAISMADVQSTRFELRGPDEKSIPLTVQRVGADSLVLALGNLPEDIGGDIERLATAPQSGWNLAVDDTLRPELQFFFGETRTIRGVTAENTVRRNPLFRGKYAFPYSEPSQNSTQLATSGLLNDELLDILEVSDGWYKVRVRTNSDPVVLNQEFWVLRWIVDNVDVPATPKPSPMPTPTPITRPTPRPNNPAPPVGYRGSIGRNYPEVQGKPSNNNQSCITGRVTRRNGAGVAAAVGNINNGGVPISWTANAAGEFSKCGLGYSNWAVVLDYIPPAAGGLPGQVVISGVWVNGNSDQDATVSFQER